LPLKITGRRIRNWYRILSQIPRYYLTAATRFGFHPIRGARSLSAALRARYTPPEAYRLGLLQPGSNAKTDRRFLSISKSTALQLRLNPPSWRVLLDDKTIFYRYCAAAGVRVPRLYGIFFQRGAGWSHSGSCPQELQAWASFFERECPEEFVVKPSLGCYGRGVRVLRRIGDMLQENGSRTLDSATLIRELSRDETYSSYVIQELVRNHSAITAMSGAEGVQTARVFTVAGDASGPRAIYAFFKIIVGRNAIDNYAGGATGNLIARIQLEDGTLYPAMTSREGRGFAPVPLHPLTGVAMEGFRLPFWKEALDLVLRAAPSFLPLRSIGWDVAMTPDGPMVIEANFNSDPPTAAGAMEEFLAALPPT
jgi:hypothetical protein